MMIVLVCMVFRVGKTLVYIISIATGDRFWSQIELFYNPAS